MDACIVFVSRRERAVAVSDFINSSRRPLQKLPVVLVVVKVEERERFVWQHQRRATIDYVVHEYSALSQSVAELFDFVCSS